MAPRASGRSSAKSKTDQASSPPRAGRVTASESPLTRQTRSSSRGIEDHPNAPTSRTKRGKTASREGSVESVGSTRSNVSSRGRKQAAARKPATRDLSMVVEDKEPAEVEEDDAPRSQSQHIQSPGAASEMSGTTAVTSRSQSQIAQIDPEIAKLLPDLYKKSAALLNLLFPTEITTETLDAVANELKTIGSERAGKLKARESDFQKTRDSFGTEFFINNSYVLQRLFGGVGSDDPDESPFRPDAINYLANLATLVKTFLVAERDGSKTLMILQTLDSTFSTAFASRFDKNIKCGGSALLEESFDIGLEIRIQYVIKELEARRDRDDFDFKSILLAAFCEPEIEPDDSPVQFKNILGSAIPNSEKQDLKIEKQLEQIRDGAGLREDSQDPFDTDMLRNTFPWSQFRHQLVTWAWDRYNEISESINQQGGLQEIVEKLMDVIAQTESHPAETDEEEEEEESRAPNHRQARIAPKTSKQSNDVVRSQKAKNNNSEISTGRAEQRSKPDLHPKSRGADDFQPDLDDDQGATLNSPPVSQRRSEYLAQFEAYNNEQNKENIATKPSKKRKRNFNEPQSDAEEIDFDSQDHNPGPSKRSRFERPTVQTDDEEDGESEQAFQTDPREPQPRKAVPASRPRQSAPGPSNRRNDPPSSPPVIRQGSTERNQTRIVSSQTAPSRSQARVARATPRPTINPPRNRSREELEEDEDEEEEIRERPNLSQARVFAREQKAAREARARKQPQKRVAWSVDDEERLIDLIEEFGCAWSVIEKQGGFERNVDQVGLKDKARNMKTALLKAGIDLPAGLEDVPLGKKEVEAVRRVFPDYEP